jgi:hypothetical protein
MWYRLFAALASISLAAVGQTTEPPPPSNVEQKKIWGDAAEHAASREANLPNFICTQTTQRFLDPTGNAGFRPIDLIVERLTYFEHHEDYKVFMINGQPSNAGHHELGGAISSGEFGSVIKGIFFPQSQTHYTWSSFFKLRGRKTHVFAYRVDASHSDYHIVVPRQKLEYVPAYHGLVFIDDTRHQVLRITLHADEVPPTFPVQDVSLALDYEYTLIGPSDYLLPLRFELRSREGAHLIKNDVTYEDYRKFGADTTIRFGAPAEPPVKPEQK